ncbi:hypothetical protein BKK49_00320 [Rodentibacter rarus]|nr:hypothetical protein BKK49_00320 [Rodentibacter rarus]
MKPQIYLALYKGKPKNRLERLQDGIIRFFTKGQYSHCEIAIARQEQWGNTTTEPTMIVTPQALVMAVCVANPST